MNKIYNVIWNASLGQLVVASERARRRGRGGSNTVTGAQRQASTAPRSARLVALVSGLGLCLLMSHPVLAQTALPTLNVGDTINTSWNGTTNSFYLTNRSQWGTYSPAFSATRRAITINGNGYSVNLATSSAIFAVPANVVATATIINTNFTFQSSTAFIFYYNSGNQTLNLNLNDVILQSVNYNNPPIYLGSATNVLNISAGGAGGLTFLDNKRPAAAANDSPVTLNSGTINFDGEVNFNNNSNANGGGAIGLYGTSGNSVLTFNGPTNFNNNSTSGASGGAIYDNSTAASTITFNGPTSFINNSVNNNNSANGGAISTSGSKNGNIIFNAPVDFFGNIAITNSVNQGVGGALFISYGNVIFNDAAIFSNNYVSSNAKLNYGGAIWLQYGNLSLSSGTQFLNNYANGGAGGGISFYGSSSIILNASTDNILFQGNRQGVTFTGTTPNSSTGTPNAIHVYDGGSSLTLNPTGTGKILFYDPISAVLGSTITKTGDGEVIFDGNAGATGYNSPVSGNTTVQAGTFSLVNQDTYGATAGTFSVNSGGTVSGSNGSALQPATIIINNGGTLNVAGGIFNLGAPSMTMAAGSLLTGNGTLNSIYNINLGAGAAGVIANIDDGDILTENARLAGTGGLTKQGGGTLVLGAVNTYTGATTISGGTVQTGVANAIQASSAVSVETGATLDMSQFAQTINNLSGAGTVLLGTQTLTANNATAASEFSGVISGSGGLTKIGTNTLTLSGDNTYTGTITISAGTLQIGNNGDTGSVAGNITDNGTLIFNRSNDASYGGIITGSGVLNQNGTGQLTLSNDASSVGSVNVNSGILNLAQTGNFTVTGNYTTANNATTVVGGNATLTVNGSFTQQANSTLNATAGSAPVINVTNATLGGTLNVDGVASDITADKASALGSVTYKLINATGTISNNFSTINFAGVSSPLDYIAPTGYVGDSNHSYYVSLGLAWMAAASQSNGVFTLPNVGDTFDVDVVLGDQAQGTTSGWDGKTLTKQGAGTLILSAQNTYDGATNIEAGTLQTGIEDAFASSSAVTVDTGATLDLNNYAQTANNLSGGGNVLLGGATLTANNESEASTFAGVISGSGGLTKTGSNTLILSGDNTYSGTTTISAGTLQIGSGGADGAMGVNSGDTISIASGAALTVNRSGVLNVAATISGAGTLNQNGSGILTLSGAGSTVGTVNVNAGTLNLAQTGALNVTGNYSTATGATTVLAAGATLNVGGSFTQAANSTLALSISSAGPEIIASSANLGGELNVTLDDIGRLGNPPGTASSLISSQHTLIQTSSGISGDFTGVNLTAPDSPVDYLIIAGGKSGNNYNVGFQLSWMAAASQSNGVFTLPNVGDSFNVDVILNDESANSVGSWDGKTLTKAGLGTLILSAQNTYDGATNIEAGTLQTGIEDAFASSSAVTVDTGATLDLHNYAQTANNLSGGGNVLLGGATLTANNESEASTFAGVISGSGGLTKTGSNTLILSGDNTYSGTTTISAGTLQIGSGGADGAMGVNSGDTISIASGAALTVNRSGVLNVAATISGAGTLNQNGIGTLTLSGTGSSVGSVNVNAGTLNLAQAGVLNVAGNYTTGNATTSLATGATLNVGGNFIEGTGSTLTLAVDTAPEISVTGTATLAGTLNITGLSNSLGESASELISTLHTLIHANSGITGDFTTLDLGGVSSTVDYAILSTGLSADRLNYNVGFILRWLAAPDQSNGVFTLADGSRFDVDVVLGDQAQGTTSGWDGKTLTKQGAGTLILSAQNTYDGATNIEAGTLQTGIEDAFASSSAVTVDTGATLDLNNYAQTANNLSGGGNVLLGGATLTANNESEASTFAGVISGSGGLTKTGSNTLILSGDNTYSGTTTISAGTLQIGSGGADGAMGVNSGDTISIASGAALTVNRSGVLNVAATISGAGTLNQNGSGILTLSGAGSTVGTVNVNAGTLNLAQTGALNVTGNYSTATGATTVLAAGATLNVGGSFTQAANSTLALSISSAGPEIIASSANLGGELNVTLDDIGRLGNPPGTASSLISSQHTLIQTSSGISGDFTGVNLTAPDSPVDYLIIAGGKSGNNYNVGFQLSWMAAASQSNGVFTLPNVGDSFNVDVILNDESANSVGSWDGKTLTKAGLGTLILSAQNTYDGATNIEAGTLQTGIEDAFASSSAVTVDTGATLDLHNYAQTANNLSGGGNVLLGGATLTANNESEASTFAGVISGSGGLTKTGSNTLILSGDNTYSGTTTISAGTLQIGSGGADGAMGVNSGDTISIASGAALTVNRSGVLNVAATISGAGTLNQNGIGTLTLSGTGSSVGSVNVNAGTLNLAPSVALSTSGNYSTASGATTALAAGATLNVGGNFVQADGSTLALAVGGSQPEISATNVSLSGTLEITGVRYVTGSSASGLNSFQYLLIASANPISGAFQSITYGGATSTVDYITIAASALSTARQYYLSAGLTWLADATQSNGVFTLADGTVFNLDVSLANQPVNAGNVHGWDGETLTKEGNGTLILSQQNTYTGATNIVAGTVKTEIVDALAQSSAVAIAANATLDLNNYNQTANNLTGAGNVTLGTATLTVDNSSATTFAGTISGDGKLSKSGTASLTLSGVNSYSGGTTISAGTLIGSASSFGTGTVDIEGALVINQSTDANFSNEIIGAGSLTKEGAGTLTLLYDSALSGPTTVAAGTLAVTGTLSNSNVQVQSGATLSGYGTVGATTINSGGTIAPSQPGSVSTLTIAGNLTQQAGSIYRARVDPASSGADLLQVNGDVTLAPGAILQVQKLDPMEFILDTKYKVLNATGTLTGTYALTGDITSAFTRLEDSYDSQNVYLTVLQDVSFVDIATTPNQRGIADALQSLPDGNPLKEAVALLGSEEEARNAFRQLTGEMHASLQSQFMEQSHFERDVANDRLRQVFGATGGAKSDIAAADIEGEPYLGLGMVNPDASQVWGRVFGSWGSTSSDGNAAGADRSISGMFVGTDTHVSDDWRVGALAGVTHSRIRVGDLSSSADSDDYTLGLYAGNQWDALSLRVGTSYTWHNISSSRAVAFTGYSDQLNASYKGNTTQVFGELGYTLHHGQVDFEPFANVSLVQESTNGFTESGSYAALSARSSDMTTTFTTLGVRAATSFEVEGKPWTTHGMLGWRHAFGDTLPASQVNLAGSTTFTTNGVAVAGDTALLELSVDAAVAKNATLNIAYTGQVGSGVHDNGIRVNLTWGF